MLLENKVAVVYGGGGAIGGAMAKSFAHAGANVFIAGRTQASLDGVADHIRANGGQIHTAVVDALNAEQVKVFADSVIQQADRIDISVNVIQVGDVQMPLPEISVDDFLQPITNTMRTQFLTTQAALPYMVKQGTGVILFFGGGGPQTIPGLGGFKVSLDALESFRRQLAVEYGQYGIRIVTIKTGGIVESIAEDDPIREVVAAETQRQALLKRVAALEDVGNVAVFIASDQARTLTGTDVNISCGALLD